MSNKLDLQRAVTSTKFDLQDALFEVAQITFEKLEALDKKIKQRKIPNAEQIAERNRLRKAFHIISQLVDLMFQEPALGLNNFILEALESDPERAVQ